jgi:hypothetical protein
MMGDIEAYLRQKYRVEGGKSSFYLRDPLLTDEENFLLMKPYCGNPFVAPGTLGSKSDKVKKNVSFADEGYFLEEETIMPNSESADQEMIEEQ